MGFLRKLFSRVVQSDEDRLIDEVRSWADSVPETVRIADCGERSKQRVAGIVRRVTLYPIEDKESLSVVVYDGTGEVTAVWTGRDHIAGLHLGSRLVLEGLIAQDREALRMVNPSFEFA